MSDLHPSHLAEIQSMGKEARNQLLTACLAVLFSKADGPFAEHVARLTGANVRKIWTPTVENYFGRIPSGMLDGIWAEVVPERAAADLGAFERLKKAEKAAHLGKLFGDADYREAMKLSLDEFKRIESWLPKEQIWPEGNGDG